MCWTRWRFPAGTRTDEPDTLSVHGSFRVYRVAGICVSEPAKIEIANPISGVGVRCVFAGGNRDRMDHVSGVALMVVSLFDAVIPRC